MLAVLRTFLDLISSAVWWLFAPILTVMSHQHNVPYAAPTRLPPRPANHPHYIQNKQGLWLHWYEWWPRPGSSNNGVPKAVVFFCTGLGEHAKRWDGLAEQWTKEQGYVIFSLDHQGHGLSEGNRKYVQEFHDYIDDYWLFIKTVYDKYNGENGEVNLSGLPRYILGHSMGGLITLHTIARGYTGNIPDAVRPRIATNTTTISSKSNSATALNTGIVTWNGIILSAPAIAIDPKLGNPILIKMSSVVSRLFPKLGIEKLAVEDLCRDRAVLELAVTDPLFPSNAFTARWGFVILHAIKDVWRDVRHYSSGYPLLIVHGGSDGIVPVSGSVEFHKQAYTTDKHLIVYPEVKHETFTDIEGEKIRSDISNFINAHF